MKLCSRIEDTPTQQKIKDILSGMTDLLLYKNRKYGDSAIHPKKIFYKGDSTNSILIRLDDKIGRVMSNTEEKPRVNDVADIIGYCTLLLVSMGVTSEDLKKFMDQEKVMVASIIVSIILILLMGWLAFGAVILNLFDRDEDSGDDYEY